MKTTRRLVLTLVVLLLALGASGAHAALADEPAAAPAAPAAPAGNPLASVNLDAYKVNLDTGNIPLAVGRHFLADLKAVNADAWASVTEAVRFDIQTEETAKFGRQKQYVIYAYGAIWAVLVVFVVGLYTRQRKLAAELAELERRVSVERK
jgi:CcmD family protein